jgi:hypothetical protein
VIYTLKPASERIKKIYKKEKKTTTVLPVISEFSSETKRKSL